MPHDIKGNLLQVGDKVMIPAVVKAIQSENDRCNCTLDSEYIMPGWNTPNTFTLNTTQVEKVST